MASDGTILVSRPPHFLNIYESPLTTRANNHSLCPLGRPFPCLFVNGAPAAIFLLTFLGLEEALLSHRC